MADPDPALNLKFPAPRSSEEMIEELYTELRLLASAKMARLAPGQTLQATALVHEAYLRVSKDQEQKWANRAHFFASAAEAMRRVLVDQARRKQAQRRGGNIDVLALDTQLEAQAPMPDDRVLQVDEALAELERENSIAAQVVKLRFFAGLQHQEVSALLDISEKTARRHWEKAKIWLYERIATKNL